MKKGHCYWTSWSSWLMIVSRGRTPGGKYQGRGTELNPSAREGADLKPPHLLWCTK
jgi:hypothetical protein